MSIAHRMINSEVGEVIANAVFATLRYPLKYEWIHSFVLRDHCWTN